MKISIVPFNSNDLNNLFFDKDKIYNFPFGLKQYFQCNGYEINTVDITSVKEGDFIIFFDLNLKYLVQAYLNHKLDKSIYIPFEPPVIDVLHTPENLHKISKLFGKILTWQDDLIDNEKFFKFYFPMPSQNFKYEEIAFKDKKFITTIVGYKQSNKPNELYSKRVEAIEYFENKYNDFEFFGAGWNQSNFKSYRGKVDSKYEILRTYKFTLCYENECNINGLISEKIFDCYYARTIPIYWGAENVQDYFPKDTYVDKREFENYEKLNTYLESMTEDEYQRRIEAIERYLVSTEFQKFSSESFAENIFEILQSPVRSRIDPRFLFWLFYEKTKIKFSKLLSKIQKIIGAK